MTQGTSSYTDVATTSPFLLSLLTAPGSAALRIENSELPSAIQVDETANHEVARRIGAGVQVYDCDPANEVEAAIGRAIQNDAGPAIARGFRKKVADVLIALIALGREYETRAYRALLDLYGPELSGDAAKGLRRLLGTASENQVDALLQRLLADKASPSDLLNVLGKVDEALIADLMKAGKRAETGLSQRVITLCRAKTLRGLTCCFTLGARANPSRLPLHGPGVRLAGAPGAQ